MDICIICKSSKKDDIQYGEFLKNKHFGVHTFCLYLSSNLLQNGKDEEGFLGFLEEDIKNEVKRISLLKCFYCRKKYANIGCCEIKCRRAFHFICGLEHYAENRFCKDFRSYCHKHAKQISQYPSPKDTCSICFENSYELGERFNRQAMILAPCCRNGWFHKLCLKKFAKTSGYFFKCPLCNDYKVFREKLLLNGIFIPNQDAAWELEPNAYSELLERPNECSAQRCENKEGRKANSTKNPFIMCHTCGSVAVHKLCLFKSSLHFKCIDCSKSLEERDSGHESLNIHSSQNEENIDVCHVSDKDDIENSIAAPSSKLIEYEKMTLGMENDSNTDSSDDEDELQTKKKRCRKILPNSEETFNSDAITDSSDDEEKLRTKKKRCIIITSSSDAESEIKPCAVKHVRRLRVESGSSTSQEVIKSNCSKTKYRTETQHCSDKEILTCTFNNRRNSHKANSSKSNNIKVLNEITDSEDINDSELEYVTTRKSNSKRLRKKTKISRSEDRFNSDAKTDSSDDEDKLQRNKKRCRKMLRSSEETFYSDGNTDSSEDEEKLQTKKKRCLIIKSSSDAESEIKPCAVKHVRRLRVESGSSASQEEIYNNTKYRTETLHCSDKEILTCTFNNRRNSQKANSSKSNKIKRLKEITDSDDINDSELEYLTTRKSNSKSLKKKTNISDSNNQEDLKPYSEILSVSEDQSFLPKQQRLRKKTIDTKNVHRISHCLITLSDKSDNDSMHSMECYLDIRGKENKRGKSACLSHEHQEKIKTESEHTFKRKKINAGKQNNLDISCIAKRTRRKTICSGGSTNKETQKQRQTENENKVDRARRKTICSRTDFGKQTTSNNLQSFEFNKSQDYAQRHGSNEVLDPTDDEQEPKSSEISPNTELNNFIVDDRHEKKYSKLNISCIADRTRKRKSLKYRQQPPLITEISDSDSSVSSMLKANDKNKQSSETANIFNFHPPNSHRPHSSNRYRF